MATVQQLGRELYARLGVVGGHLDRLGGQLAKAVDTFNQTVGSVESRVLVTARRLHELGIGDQEVPAIRYIESRPRVAGFSDINE
jgi:DNA recombination protein RmuC